MIDIANLTKHFGPKVAVDNLSLSVQKGQVLGFLGPNGAGKSTTMRMITGYLPPTSGSIVIGGIDMLEDPNAAKARIGYLPESAPLYQDMTVEGFLSFAAELRGLDGQRRRDAVGNALSICFLEGVRRQAIDTLSKGYRHRTCLAQAIIHDPEVLILDEPTDGLDPNQKDVVRNLIRDMGKTKAIIFSTHILEEVEACCTRAVIIDRGKVVADGTPDHLKRHAARAGSVTVRFQNAPGGLRQDLEKLKYSARLEAVETTGSTLSAVVYPKTKADASNLSAEIYELARTRNLALSELHEEPGRLDEMFRELTSQNKV
ncbi:MAG: ATP-binding cassette domain-containing protein [Verrucomicrobiaceae bacterium]|nr:MAG: ATP-binding cassette domain-containing protein [Verrucomicrobiaceae bacterium]